MAANESEPIGLIAGGGPFPIIFAREASAQGHRVIAIGHRTETDPALTDVCDVLEWVHLGQVRRVLRFFKKHRVRQAVMMGTVQKTRLFSDLRPDLKAIALLATMRHTHDDNILRAFAALLEKEGILIRESTFLVPHMLAPEGCWTRRRPSKVETADIDLGWRIAKTIGGLDIGQCVVVGGGSVLAVEAIDGTDATIRRGGGLGSGQAVVVKVCKPNQDFRFDVPAIGTGTIAAMAEAGATALAVEASRAVVFDRERMIADAEAAGIAILARSDPPPPVTGNGTESNKMESHK